MLSPDNFFSELLVQFPKIAAEFNSEDEDHYKMGRFATYSIEQIEQKNIEELKKCFGFIETHLEAITPDLENALNVSYCEALLGYDDYKRGIEMKKVMPEKLLRLYMDYKNYYNSLG